MLSHCLCCRPILCQQHVATSFLSSGFFSLTFLCRILSHLWHNSCTAKPSCIRPWIPLWEVLVRLPVWSPSIWSRLIVSLSWCHKSWYRSTTIKVVSLIQCQDEFLSEHIAKPCALHMMWFNKKKESLKVWLLLFQRSWGLDGVGKPQTPLLFSGSKARFCQYWMEGISDWGPSGFSC